MKTKKYEEVTYIPNTTIKELKYAIHIVSGIAIIVCIVGIFIGIEHIRLATKYEALKIENNELVKVNEMKESMISDLQEDNIKLQEMIKWVKKKQ